MRRRDGLAWPGLLLAILATLPAASADPAQAPPATPAKAGTYWAAALSADGTLLWCEHNADPDELDRRAWLALRLLRAHSLDFACSDDAQRHERLAAIDDWSALIDAARVVRVGAEARASLIRAMEAAQMATAPEHIETDGAMAICNRCGGMWVPGANHGAGSVTWRELRVRLAEFIAGHRPCGVARHDGRIGLAPEERARPGSTLADAPIQFAARGPLP